MKINWFSPLPPIQSGIADYTARLLPFLRRRAELTVWTNQSEWDRSLEQQCAVRAYEPDRVPWQELNRADATVYHIGNHPHFHGAIWQVSRRSPGIVVLHEIRLQHFFMIHYSESGSPHEYLSQMERLYGRAGLEAGRACLEGRASLDDLSENFPLTTLATENSLGVVVHSKNSFEILKQESGVPVGYAPLAYSVRPAALDRGAAVCDGGPPYKLVLFGHLGSNRRVNALFKALAELPERESFRLTICGTLLDSGRIEAQANLPALRGLVEVRGFVSESDLDRVLESAHLAINLRYPTMGEASFSQLRIWEHALPSIVTRTGWYASLPDEAVAFVRLEHEIEDIQTHLRAFLADPARFAAMGERGRRLAEHEHAPDRYVDVIVRMAELAPDAGAKRVAREMAERMGKAMNHWSGERVSHRFYRKPAEEIYRLLLSEWKHR